MPRLRQRRVAAAAAAVCCAAAAPIDLPCDPARPYVAPRDPRLDALWDRPVPAAADCGKGSDWLGPWVPPSRESRAPLAAFSRRHNETLHWGPFVPDQIFALRTRTQPAGVVSGVWWGRGAQIRGAARRQEKEGELREATWTHLDHRSSGRMHVEDQGVSVAAEFSFVKPRYMPKELLQRYTGPAEWATAATAGAAQLPVGSEGAVHTRAKHAAAAAKLGPLSLYWYVAADCGGAKPPCGVRLVAPLPAEDGVGEIRGTAPPGVAAATAAGDFALRFTARSGDAEGAAGPAPEIEFACGTGGAEEVGDVIRRAWNGDADSRRSAACSAEGAGIVVARITAPSHTHNVSLTAALAPGHEAAAEALADALQHGASWQSAGEARSYELFQRAFRIHAHDPGLPVARHAVYQLLGSAAFWHGGLDIRAEGDGGARNSTVLRSDPVSLFGFAPSRRVAVQPHAVLSEEGYHLRAILGFDRALAAEVLARWMSTARGHLAGEAFCPGAWIPARQAPYTTPPPGLSKRQRLLNAQSPRISAPPGLLVLVAEQLLNPSEPEQDAAPCAEEGDPDAAATTLAADPAEEGCMYSAQVLRDALLPVLQAWQEWIVANQKAPEEAYFLPSDPPMSYWDEEHLEAELKDLPLDQLSLRDEDADDVEYRWPDTGLYQWRGRDPFDGRLIPVTESSGLGDYPRAYWPSNHEAHADLASWIAAGDRALANLVEAGAEQGSREGLATDEAAKFHRDRFKDTLIALDAFHWDRLAGMYADRGLVAITAARKGTVAAGAVVQPGMAMQSEVLILCANKKNRTMAGGIPESALTGIVQREQWRGEYWDEMRVRFNATVQFPKTKRIVAQGTPATIRSIPGARGEGTIDIQTDTGVIFTAEVGDIEPILSDRDWADFCPAGYPRFLQPVADGKGGVLTRQRLSSYEPPQPGRLTSQIGLAALTPLLLRLIPYDGKNGRVDQMLATLHADLVGENGVRTLSKRSVVYDVANTNHPGDSPSHRGAMHVSLNYLTLAAISHYAREGSTMAKQVLEEAEHRLAASVMRSFDMHGTLWERYDAETATGAGAKHYAGGNALLARLIGQIFE